MKDDGKAAPGSDTNLSGILVIAETGQVDEVCQRLRALEGVEVHGVDRPTGRIVVVQEAPDVGAEVAGFGRIRALPGVMSADLVCHWFGDQPAPPSNDALSNLGIEP